MSLRWKNNPVNEIRTNPNYEDFDPMRPQPIPTQMRGMPQQQPQTGAPVQGSLMGDFMDAERLGGWNRPQYNMPQPVQDGVQAEIASLQTELASIERQIQEIDAQYPQLKNGGQEWEIAAKRAEIGDMSAYDSMMARGSAANGAVSGIENELYNAYKFLYGLNAQNDYEQGAYANQIETALRRADEWSARNPNAKMPPIYADLRDKYDAWKARKAGNSPEEPGEIEVNNSDETINKMTSKIKAKTYSRKDEKELQTWIDTHSNSPYTKAIQDFINTHKNDTVEARKEWETKKAQAEVAVRNWNRNRDIADKKNEWNRLVKNKAPVTLFYKLDEFGNPVPKGGV